MGKLPAFQFYTGDWMKDPSLSMCSPATRGIWIDLLCAMHELDRSGQVTGTTDQLARICRCTASEMSAAIAELKDTKTAQISERDGRITVTSRRMSRECHERDSARERKQNQRSKSAGPPASRDRHADVTSYSSSSSSISASNAHSPPSSVRGARAGDLPEGVLDHPVIRAYWDQFRVEEIPSIATQERAMRDVVDLGLWRVVLDYWRDNNYRPESLGKMVSCYLEGGPRAVKQSAQNGQGVSKNVSRLRDTMARRAREDAEDRGHIEQIPPERQLAGVRR